MPINLQDLANDNRTIWLWCRDCFHEVETDPLSIGLPADHPVPNVAGRMKCSICGSKAISARGQVYDPTMAEMRDFFGRYNA